MEPFILPDQSAGRWFVLHTKSRQEKALAEDLKKLHVQHYLPLVRSIKYYGKRKFTVEEPLFPGYVFLRGTLDQAYTADRTKRIASILQVADQAQIEADLTNLALAISRTSSFDPFPYLRRGVRVEVKSGPLRGLRGLIENRDNVDRLILAVEMLGQAVTVEIHGALLDVVDHD